MICSGSTSAMSAMPENALAGQLTLSATLGVLESSGEDAAMGRDPPDDSKEGRAFPLELFCLGGTERSSVP